MYPSQHARELAILLRISRELDIVGDLSATVDDPSELVAWAAILGDTGAPAVTAWRAHDSGHRYVQVAADHQRAPIRGHVAAVLPCERHREFWSALGLDPLEPGTNRTLEVAALSAAWAVMPIAPPEADASAPSPPPTPAPD